MKRKCRLYVSVEFNGIVNWIGVTQSTLETLGENIERCYPNNIGLNIVGVHSGSFYYAIVDKSASSLAIATSYSDTIKAHAMQMQLKNDNKTSSKNKKRQ
jgi:hypothetical protein